MSDHAATPPKMEQIVTIVIVTSPTTSNPSTEMIDRCISGVVRSFPVLANCRVVIACDGVQVLETAPSKKRIFGKCTQESFDRYQAYCATLQERSWLTVLRQTEWQGFAISLRETMRINVQTPLVMVLPHDYELTPPSVDIDFGGMIQEMLQSTDINYIGLPNARSSTLQSRHARALQGLTKRSICDGTLVLEPIGMWKENPHVAKVEAYQSIVFQRHYERGQFIEDTLGQEMLAQLKEHGPSAFGGTYMLCLGDEPCSFHMDGPRYLPIAERLQRGYKVQEFEKDSADQAASYVKSRDLGN